MFISLLVQKIVANKYVTYFVYCLVLSDFKNL